MRGANAAFVLGWEAPGAMRGRHWSKPARGMGMALGLELGARALLRSCMRPWDMGMRALHPGKEHALS